MRDQKFSSADAIRFGWNATKVNFRFFLSLLALPALINLALLIHIGQPTAEALRSTNRTDSVTIVWFAIGFFLLNFLWPLGLVRISLRLCNGGRPSFMEFLSSYRWTVEYLITWLVLGFATVFSWFLWGGVLLFSFHDIVPPLPRWAGAILILVLLAPLYIVPLLHAFFVHLIVEGRCSGTESLKRSFAITRGHRWNLLVFYLLLVGINVLGALCALFGLLATVPTTLIAHAFVYCQLMGSQPSCKVS